jgi:hypothetical protein
MTRLLLIGDHPALRKAYPSNHSKEGFTIATAVDGAYGVVRYLAKYSFTRRSLVTAIREALGEGRSDS